jgi:hypothetical protein
MEHDPSPRGAFPIILAKRAGLPMNPVAGL